MKKLKYLDHRKGFLGLQNRLEPVVFRCVTKNIMLHHVHIHQIPDISVTITNSVIFDLYIERTLCIRYT